MSCRTSVLLSGALSLLVLSAPLALSASASDSDPRETPPQRPLVEGRQVFEAKGCVRCHAVRDGAAALRVGPDLARSGSWSDVMQFAGSLWNHTPAMTRQDARAGDRAAGGLARRDGQARGLPLRGQVLRRAGQRGTRARALRAALVRALPPTRRSGRHGRTAARRAQDFVSSLLHGPSLVEPRTGDGGEDGGAEGRAAASRRRRCRRHRRLHSRRRARTRQSLELAYAQAGSPQAGKALFPQKGCSQCHAIAGTGGTVGPDLGVLRPQAHVGEMAAALWNHGPPMWAKMKELGRPVPETQRCRNGRPARLPLLRAVHGPGAATRRAARTLPREVLRRMSRRRR